MSTEHRATAADWGTDPLAPLLREYASTGAIVPGLDDEVRAAMWGIEHGEFDSENDVHKEYERLAALLDEVQPKLVVRKARELGRGHGTNAAARWQRDVLGGQATGRSVALARRVLAGLADDDDPAAVFGVLPGPSEEYTATQLATDCGWPEPDVEDREAHHRWDTAQLATCDAYATAFTDAMFAAVELACRNELAHAARGQLQAWEASGSDQNARPTVRPAGSPTRPFLRPEDSTEQIPPGWIAEPAGVVGTTSDDVVEVIYNPRRHDVMRVPRSRSEAALEVLGDQGWSTATSDGTSDLLWRDRVAHTRAALERSATRSAVEIESPSL